MTTLYFCHGCIMLLGDSPRDSLMVEDGECSNCLDTGPHFAGEFTEANAEAMMSNLEGEMGVEEEADEDEPEPEDPNPHD